jgi:hypothetical protein
MFRRSSYLVMRIPSLRPGAELVAESLTNEIHLIFSDMGHGNFANRCSAGIFESFIESASIEGLDTACVEDVKPPPFFVDFSGPRP